MNLEILPHNMVSGLPAIIVAWGLHVGLPVVAGLISLTQSLRAARRARAADAQVAGSSAGPLAPGPACIHGPVEYAPGQTLALRIAIEQVGKNHKGKNDTWSHVWTEASRSVTAVPFYLRDDRGTRVRVEPNEKALLVDRLDHVVRHSENTRTRFAELTEGEVVYVVGELAPGRDPAAGGYREADNALVMRPPSNGTRLVVSTEPLSERFRRKANQDRAFAIFYVLFLVAFGLGNIGYHSRVFAGHVETGRLVRAIHHGGKGAFCALEIDLANTERIDLETSSDMCSRLAIGQDVPVYVVGSRSFAHVGQQPAIHVAGIGLALVLLSFVAIAYKIRDRAWYEFKAVDSGSGKLSESTDL